MIKGVYSMFDVCQGFLTPIFEDNDALALRNFSFAMQSANTLYRFRPTDFSFYKLGTFDTHDGTFELISPAELVARGDSVSERSVSREKV
nr:MAG: DNA binding protein [Microviridae sp.]